MDMKIYMRNSYQEENLMRIYNNIIDLMVPFYNRDYYTKDMKGSYSIKYVLPALFPGDPSLNYKSLDLIHNGIFGDKGSATTAENCNDYMM